MSKKPSGKPQTAASQDKASIEAVLRRHLGTADVVPHSSVAGEDVTRAVRAAYRAGLRMQRQRADSLATELRDVLDWARTEKAPLRSQEIASIERVLVAWQAAATR